MGVSKSFLIAQELSGDELVKIVEKLGGQHLHTGHGPGPTLMEGWIFSSYINNSLWCHYGPNRTVGNNIPYVKTPERSRTSRVPPLYSPFAQNNTQIKLALSSVIKGAV